MTKDKTKLVINSESWNEDNFAIAYLCKGLDGYMRMYQKKYYGLYNPSNRDNVNFTRCLSCGGLFNKKNNKHKYCSDCSTRIKKEKDRLRMANKRMVENRKSL